MGEDNLQYPKNTRLQELCKNKNSDILFDKLMNTTQDCIFWKDTDRRFVGVNKAFLDFYGFVSEDAVIGKTDEDMGWHPDPEPFKQDEIRVLQGVSTHNVRGQCIIRGEVREIMATKTPIYDNGEIIGFIGSFMDVTDEQKRIAKIEKLNKLNDRLLTNEKRANRRMSEFLSRMSNEIKSPMNAISALSYLGMNQDDVAVLKNDMRKIYTSSHYLASLMSDLLDIDKIDGGSLNLEPQVATLDEIVDGIEGLTVAISKDKNIRVLTNRDYKGNPSVICDLGRTQQMIINLTMNAIKFSEPGDTVEINISSEKLEDSYRFTFVVKDEGCGMNDSFIPSLFKPFAQEKRNPSKYGAGTGLGLAVSKRLAGLMHGDILVESEEGIGSSFTAIFELKQADSENS